MTSDLASRSALAGLLEEQAQRLNSTANLPGEVSVVHVGLMRLPMGDLFRLVHHAHSRPVRSGHLGNWEEIWRGRVGLVDYNRYICRDYDMATPLLHTHTDTESGDRTSGDTIYLPGGVVSDGDYRRLPLHELVDGQFRQLPESESRCCAYVYVDEGGEFRSLVEARIGECTDRFSDAGTIADALLQREGELRQLLKSSLRGALSDSQPLRLEDVVGGSVDTRGRRGSGLTLHGTNLQCNGTSYSTVGAVVDAIIETLQDGSVNHRPPAPRDDGMYRPLIGAAMVIALTAVLHTSPISTSRSLHLHWGAISMSGYPPRSGGYFARRSTRRTLRNLARAFAQVEAFDRTVRFALLPAPVLSLLPPAEFDTDVALTAELFERVLDTRAPGADPNVAQAEIDDRVDDWLEGSRDQLSDYYKQRFFRARSVQHASVSLPDDGRPASPESFERLTVQQGSMILGALLTNGERRG